MHRNLSKLWTFVSGFDGENMYPEFQVTSYLYFLMSDSKGAMMASKGTDSSSFWEEWILLSVASAANCAESASLRSVFSRFTSKFCQIKNLLQQ